MYFMGKSANTTLITVCPESILKTFHEWEKVIFITQI